MGWDSLCVGFIKVLRIKVLKPKSNIKSKIKPTLESLLRESQVITGKDLIRRKEDKVKELALFQEAIEFEARHRKPKN